MKNLFLFFTLIIIFSCVSKNKISETEKENIKKELSEMVEIDQKYAGIPFGKYIRSNDEESWKIFTRARDSVNQLQKNRIEELVKKYGFLGIDKVGKDSSHNFWLIVQHSDNFPELQKMVLKMMVKEVEKNNANKPNYAYLFDRIRKNEKQKQFFGTQLEYNKLGQATPIFGLEDSMNVDKRRKEYELMPLKEYLNRMTEMHYEMNKEFFRSQGIAEPQLYK